MKTEVVVIGAGPGGYAAAFKAAEAGKKVVLIEGRSRLGGVCLNEGCIPSKALLQSVKVIRETKKMVSRGIEFSEPKLDLDKLRNWKESVLDKLGAGIANIAKRRNVQVLTGTAEFQSSQSLKVGEEIVEFEKAIIATGSTPSYPKMFDLDSPLVMTSTDALKLADIPKRLLVVGGGYIGMELGTVYSALGSNVVVAEALDTILAGADADLVRPVKKFADENFEALRLSANITAMELSSNAVKVTMEFGDETLEETYDRVLVSVGRAPNTANLGLSNTKVELDEKGFVQVGETQQSTDLSIYAIGDVAGGILLAHQATREAAIAVETIVAKSTLKHTTIPMVVFTDPEVAWCGLTETEAKAGSIEVDVVRFLWAASGRAVSMERTDGVTKLILEKGTEKILGVGIVGPGAGELIAEGVLAVDKGLTAKDLSEVIHPHPTLSETLMESAELFYGTSPHMITPKRR